MDEKIHELLRAAEGASRLTRNALVELCQKLAREVAKAFPDEATVAAAETRQPRRLRSITDRLHVMLAERVLDETGRETDKDYGDMVALALVREATARGKNSVTAAKEILARVDGPLETRVTGANGGPLVFQPKLSAIDPELLKRGETPKELTDGDAAEPELEPGSGDEPGPGPA